MAEKIANEYTGYDKYGQYHCWSQSTLRDWLNGSFLTGNFSSEEIALLKKNTIITDKYSVDDYDGWNEEEIRVTTEDKVYIPSKADIEKYGIDPVPEKTSGNYYYNDDRNNAGWLRDRGHGILWARPTIETEYYDDGRLVIFGHTPTGYFGKEHTGKMVKTKSWICVDTGAANGGLPMLLRIDDMKEFYLERDMELNIGG